MAERSGHVDESAMQADVVSLTEALIRIDSSNWGPSTQTVGEAEIAEYSAERLREAGWDPEVFRTTSDGRRGVYLRIPGTDASAPALLLHGHLDVVPAMAADWTHPPLSGYNDGTFVWGRGAVDMKDMDAMILAVARAWGFSGARPRRDTVILLMPDEEAGSKHGSHWLAEHRIDMFDGVTEAIGEVGGFSITVRDNMRLYPIMTAEKGVRWMTLRSSGRAGHGSMIHPDNAVTAVAEAIARVGRYTWPRRETKTVQRFLEELSEAFDMDLTHADVETIVEKLGTLGYLVGATLQNTANPTMLEAGYKHNVIPTEASGVVDGRVLPGYEREFEETLVELAGPDVVVEPVWEDIAIEAPFDTVTFDLMDRMLRDADPGARAVPYMVSGGTDAKAFSAMGIACYGFSPLRMPADLDYWRMFHGVDERVPVDGLTFGVGVLDRFLRAV